MAKIKLGQRPVTFKSIPVAFQMPDGSEGVIECTFKYRTRTEFGALLDQLFAEAGESAPEGGKFSVADLMTKTRDKNADYLLQVLHGWNLDEDLSLASLQALADELPGAAVAIMDKYRAAAAEGRLGN